MVEVNRKTTEHYGRNPYAARLATILASMVTTFLALSHTIFQSEAFQPALSPCGHGRLPRFPTGTATVHACNLARFNRYG